MASEAYLVYELSNRLAEVLISGDRSTLSPEG
jgi:hypothetical protein